MSALQASKMYKVTERTLYDRLKKMGILTTNMKKKIQMQHKDKDYMLAALEAENGKMLIQLNQLLFI